MTQLEALKELLEKVEAGNWGPFDGPSNETGLSDWCLDFDKIMLENSMDAALSLFDAVLPGPNQFSVVTDPTCIKATVCFWPNGLSGKVEVHGEGWHEAIPARALLIAILKAKIAELEA